MIEKIMHRSPQTNIIRLLALLAAGIVVVLTLKGAGRALKAGGFEPVRLSLFLCLTLSSTALILLEPQEPPKLLVVALALAPASIVELDPKAYGTALVLAGLSLLAWPILGGNSPSWFDGLLGLLGVGLGLYILLVGGGRNGARGAY